MPGGDAIIITHERKQNEAEESEKIYKSNAHEFFKENFMGGREST